jgi:pimeloyl-ACP methyl ester carboxylesterase
MAYVMVAGQEADKPPLDGQTRDALAARLTDELTGHAMGVGEFLLRPLKGMATRLATRRLTRDRGAVTDATSPAAGDVLRFLSHGDDVRTYLAGRIADCEPPVTLLGHSLGGVMVIDLLARQPVDGVETVVTVGSQAGFLYEIGVLGAPARGQPLPDHFPPWLNVYDQRDILSYLAGAVFGAGRAIDIEVDNGLPFPQSHSGYWHNTDTWQAIATKIAADT